MATKRSILALDRDPSVRLLPWLVGAMVFLGTLAVAGWIGIERATASWQHVLSDVLTVQISDGPEAEAQVNAASRVLVQTPGVSQVRVLSRAEVARLLEPWLGRFSEAAILPLPRLIDVQLEQGISIDHRALRARLSSAVPEARLDDHGAWLERLVRLTHGLEALAIATVLLVGSTIAAIVIFAVRGGLLVHREAIEVMHQIGAQDSFIATQFQRLTLKLALRGAIPGLIIAAAAIFGLGLAADTLQAPLFPRVHLGVEGWLILLVVPVSAVMIAIWTARRTVIGNLKRHL